MMQITAPKIMTKGSRANIPATKKNKPPKSDAAAWIGTYQCYLPIGDNRAKPPVFCGHDVTFTASSPIMKTGRRRSGSGGRIAQPMQHGTSLHPSAGHVDAGRRTRSRIAAWNPAGSIKSLDPHQLAVQGADHFHAGTLGRVGQYRSIGHVEAVVLIVLVLGIDAHRRRRDCGHLTGLGRLCRVTGSESENSTDAEEHRSHEQMRMSPHPYMSDRRTPPWHGGIMHHRLSAPEQKCRIPPVGAAVRCER